MAYAKDVWSRVSSDYLPGSGCSSITICAEIVEIKPKKVISNKNATIVLWNDDTKTVVKRYNEEHDLEKAVAIAYAKKMFGGYRKFKKLFKIEEE